MKVTLKVNGREQTFSEEELVQILEEYFRNKNSENLKKKEVLSVENQWINVNPCTINPRLFEKQRENPKQEETRKIIVDALETMKKDQQYQKAFQIYIPNKTWKAKTFKEMEILAHKDGGHITNWVELALEWAQRLTNGESWESLCNDPDIANWNRIVIWKDGIALVGGSTKEKSMISATEVDVFEYLRYTPICDAVPSITRTKKS